MNRWPGQGYEYVENVLFEKGPAGSRKNKAPFQPLTVEAKEINATQQQQKEAETHLT